MKLNSVTLLRSSTTTSKLAIRIAGILLCVATIPLVYWAVLNWAGPSSAFYDPAIETARPCPEGQCIYLGDEFRMRYTVIRHRLNGSCLLKIWRYGEDIDGPTPGRRHLLDYAELQFVGAEEMRHPRWPSPPRQYHLGYEVNEQLEPQLDKPLLPPGVDRVTMDFYVVARYFCNPLDTVFPRFLQGGIKPDETERARAVLKRFKP